MKINKKTWLIIGIIFAEAVFLLSIFSGYSLYSFSFRTSSNINFVEYKEPDSNTLHEIISKGKVAVIIFSNSFESEDFYLNLSKEFYNEIVFFLVYRNVSQAILISPLGQSSTFNLTSQNLIKEICKLAINVPPTCTEI